jgi:dCMP deaminase
MDYRLTKDSYFIKLLALVSARSTCVRRSVGAIIVDAKGHILSTGYNGSPSGFPHCIATPCPGAGDRPGDSSRCEAVHAEQNALLSCHRLDLAHKIYTSVTPCFTCAKLILSTPISFVVAVAPYPGDNHGESMLRSVGKLYFYDHESGVANICSSFE